MNSSLLLSETVQTLRHGCIALAFCILGSAPADLRAEDIADIAHQMREARDKLLHLPSGFILDYRVEVDQDVENPAFTFIHGADGVLGIKWPQLYCRLEGEIYVTTDTAGIVQRKATHRVREGDYNFENKTGAGRSGRMVQISDYRHGFSAQCLPISFQYFQECSQRYYPGTERKSQLYLPNAFSAATYEVVGTEVVSGVDCVVVANGEVDKIWIAPNQSYVVCRRLRRSPTSGHLLERLEASDLQEISPDIWFPMQQVHEKFHKETGELRRSVTLTVTRVVTKGITEDQLRITIPDDVSNFQDHITGKIVGGLSPDKSHDSAVKEAALLLDAPIYHGRMRGVISLTVVSLCLLIAVGVFYGIRRRQLAA